MGEREIDHRGWREIAIGDRQEEKERVEERDVWRKRVGERESRGHRVRVREMSRERE